LRGMFAWAGFKQIAVQYHRKKRQHGTSKYPLAKMLHFAWNAALSFSIIPIRAISISGALVAAFGLTYGFYSILRYFVSRMDNDHRTIRDCGGNDSCWARRAWRVHRTHLRGS
jgi:hypothetical protein